jgi:hypothetical protein
MQSKEITELEEFGNRQKAKSEASTTVLFKPIGGIW